MKVISFSHKGQRSVNQDFVIHHKVSSDLSISILADGMGGYSNGEIASKIVSENILTFLSHNTVITAENIQKAVNKANLALRQVKSETQVRMGSTIGGVIISDKTAYCFWVGDVKIFHFVNKELQNESKPHTLINDLKLNGSFIDTSKISKYRHIVTRSVQGDIQNSIIDSFIIENISFNDVFIICSDGVHDILEGVQLEKVYKSCDHSFEFVNQIEKKLKKEANDNFSLIMISH